MGTYKGTGTAETITPTLVSSSVSRLPAWSFPSGAADTIDGGGRGDVLSGGGGNDTIYDRPTYRSPSGSTHSVAVTPNDGNRVHGDAGHDNITVEVGDTDGANPVSNIVYGDDGNDSIIFRLSARNYPDSLWESAPTGTVTLYGGAGNDLTAVRGYYVGSSPGMTVYQHGGAGNDELLATTDEYDPDGSVMGRNNNDYLYGGPGNDKYTVMEAKDTVVERAGEGADTVFAYETDYVLPANVENMEMTGGYYPEGHHATGNGLNNLIRIERYYGGSDYTIDGMGGNDVLYGSPAGNDTINGGAGNDTLYGKEAGDDDAGYYLDNDLIRGGSGDDLIYGGGGGADTWDGNDRLYGDGGADRIFGQHGNDTLSGGGGRDRLTGGGGNDTFDYDSVTDSPTGASRDVILDFGGMGAAAGDRIDLSTIDANPTLAGNQAFAFVGTGSIASAGQLRLTASPTGTDTLIQANTGGSSAPELEIAVTDGATLPGQWSASDFIL